MTKTVLILAYLLFAEAGGEGKVGVNHAASVVLNSAQVGVHLPVALLNEAFRKGRYSSMKGLTYESFKVPRFTNKLDREMWDYCIVTASAMCRGAFKPVIESNHFYNPNKCRPYWAPLLRDTRKVGNHVFGKLLPKC